MSSPVRRTVDLSIYPDLVVIYLGYRAHSLRGIGQLLRIGRGLREIKRHPPEGLLCHENLLFGPLHPGFRQYWRDLESLEAFTRDTQHAAWWRDFSKDGAGGIWHETYRLGGGMEAIYLGMPQIGFGRFAPALQAEGGLRNARQRLSAVAGQA